MEAQKVRPILFNTEMVRAILANQKTVTRRVVKPQPRKIYHGGTLWENNGDLIALVESQNRKLEQAVSPFRPGDILYVETWQNTGNRYIYKADVDNVLDDVVYHALGWRPSIHMPKEAARIFLRVTDVRVEQLQDITERGELSAAAEGFVNDINLYNGTGASAVKRFADFWDSAIRRKDRVLYGWGANPWVWVIAFERISKEEAEHE